MQISKRVTLIPIINRHQRKSVILNTKHVLEFNDLLISVISKTISLICLCVDNRHKHINLINCKRSLVPCRHFHNCCTLYEEQPRSISTCFKTCFVIIYNLFHHLSATCLTCYTRDSTTSRYWQSLVSLLQFLSSLLCIAVSGANPNSETSSGRPRVWTQFSSSVSS